MADIWINPKYADLVEFIRNTQDDREENTQVAKCGTCRGLGRHIYTDPKTKKKKALTCLDCQGSGEKSPGIKEFE